MLFGDPDRFAVQIDLEDSSRWLNGRRFYWIEGAPFGDPFLSIPLIGEIDNLATIVKDGCQRSDALLTPMSDEAAFDFISRHLTGDELLEVLDTAARFDLVHCGQAFGPGQCFAFDEGGQTRILLGSLETGFQRRATCPTTLIEDAFFDAYMYLNRDWT
jgi:hypothetical protein